MHLQYKSHIKAFNETTMATLYRRFARPVELIVLQNMM